MQHKLKFAIPNPRVARLVLITAVSCAGVGQINAGWTLYSTSGSAPTYYGSPNNTSDSGLYWDRQATWSAGTLSATATSMDMELSSMTAESICYMGCLYELGGAEAYDTNFVTNAWVQAVGSATWNWPGGSSTTTTVSNHVSLTGWVSLDLDGGDGGTISSAYAWVQGGTNGVPPYGWVRCVVNATNTTPTGIATIFDNRGSWNSGYPYNASQTNCAYPNPPVFCDPNTLICLKELQVYGYFTLEYDTTVYQVSAGATSITINLSADCTTKATIGDATTGGGCIAYANATAQIYNGSILAYLQN